ncbi:MAG: hypothetical protein IJ796_04330 [Lachnospiraceae bacterium]|nr:hypothetical protein [Lachnospiraceae bacterium]
MADKNIDLGNEWKNTVYNLGGAFVGLGKTVIHSVKKGVDIAYDFMNEEDAKQKKNGPANGKTDNTSNEKYQNSSEDRPEKVDGEIIEE